ncbi:beta-glucosidase [Dactylonectria estremocensis]|uniref:beta-glucosidase n=1 Tax=Dactylonectria estremocensis TaxID=1079267 RepID=A0A9P9EBU7_9HYPO|nr:beta-glucosidase [Dactylonectria estremocensis]
MDVEALIEQLTLEEKVALTAGTGWWHTTAIDRLNIPSIRLSDGPNGVRGTHFFDSTPSACLPCGTALGSTFDTSLAERIGRLLSDEAHAKGAHVLLGPTINIQRGPLGGRGFESVSEDPILSGIIAGHYVRGVQESGVSATLKHFVCNDMESERMAVDSLVTARAMREIYLLPFMLAIEMAQPRAVMTSYGKVNGCHAAEHRQLLQEILRDEWKWDGLVMSDWYGTYSTSEAINAGLDLEMPGPTRWRGEALVHAVTANKVKKATLDERVRNVLRLIKHGLEKTSIPPNAPERQLNTPEHVALLREAAAKSIVLLKNERDILPFDRRKKIAVIGPNANIATYCGGGSAGLRAYKAVTPLEGIRSLASDVVFSQGAYGHQMLPVLGKALRTGDGKTGFALRFYNDPPSARGQVGGRKMLEERVLDDSYNWFAAVRDAVRAAAEADQVVLCVGLSGEWECEGQDRSSMALPPGTDALVEAVVAANPNTAVVVQSGTPVAMPWVDRAGAVLQAWFGGNESGNGIADVLFGEVNPAGKLPLTMPRRVADNPSALSFRSENGRVLYSEDVYVGYRWYDTLDIEPLFAFGHGLSYTTFELSGANGHAAEAPDALVVHDADQLTVKVQIANTGSLAGAEVVQVYVKPAAPTPLTSSPRATITRPAKELKGFAKVHVEPGANETGAVTLDLLRATSYWSEMDDCWRSDAGSYGILVGSSSRGAFLEKTVVLTKSRTWRGLRNGLLPASSGFLSAYSACRTFTLARRACDACRARRRRCVFADGPPERAGPPPPRSGSPSQAQCQDCIRLGISCSFLVPTRTRGPKRRLVLIALAALTVGLLPSRFSAYRAMAPDVALRFDTRMAMINVCVDVCMRLRTHSYWDHINLRKWAVCYLLSVGCFQTGQTNRSRMLEVESMQVGRLLGLHRISDYEGLNRIETQLRKKAFWLMFYTFAHSTLLAGRRERLAFLDHSMLHEVNFEALIPMDLDDEWILENSILSPPSPAVSPSTPGTQSQPASPLGLTSGFILHSRVFLKSVQEAISPGYCDWERRHTPEVRLSRLRNLLLEIRYMLDDVPGPMRQWASTGDRPSDASHPPEGRPAMSAYDAQPTGKVDLNAKALPGQVEIMRANLHGTHLWVQSLLLDQIDVLLQKISQKQDASDAASYSAALKSSWTEREDVCRQMLHLLHSMPYAHLEPNGLYLTYKVRDVGVTLLNCPYEAHERPARRAAEYMRDFTRALSRLDRSEIVNTSSLKSWVDVDREIALS